MKARSMFLFSSALLVLLVACKKDEIDLDTLNSNPFDIAYTGPAIFSFVTERTLPYQVDSSNVGVKLEVDVRVNTSTFPRPTSYTVQYTLPNGLRVNVPSADLQDDLFTMTLLDVVAGTEYCFFPRLGNNGSYSVGNTVCGTAE